MSARRTPDYGPAICAHCAQPFTKRQARHRFCSERCGYEWRLAHNPPCVIAGCDGTAQREGMCQTHFARKRDGRPIDAPIKRRRPAGVICSVEGCERSGGHGHGLCGTHASRLKRCGDVQAHIPVKTLRAKGEGWTDANGYRRIGDTREHRIVMQRLLGRPLASDEHVHHINGDRQDNRPENLELWVTRRQPRGQRVTDRIDDAVATLERYAPDRLAAQAAQLRVA